MPTPEAHVFRGAAVPTAVVAVPLLVGSAVVAGLDGFFGALAGAGLVAVFFGFGFFVDRRTRAMAPTAVMGVAMITYLLKVTLLAIVLVSLKGTTAFNSTAFAVVSITLTVVWLGGEVKAFTTARFRYVEPTPATPEPASPTQPVAGPQGPGAR